MQQSVVEDKIAGTACVLGRFEDTLLTFPVTGVRCTKKTADGLARVAQKTVLSATQENSSFFCGVTMDSLRSEGQGTIKTPWKADQTEAGTSQSPWGSSVLVVTQRSILLLVA